VSVLLGGEVKWMETPRDRPARKQTKPMDSNTEKTTVGKVLQLQFHFLLHFLPGDNNLDDDEEEATVTMSMRRCQGRLRLLWALLQRCHGSNTEAKNKYSSGVRKIRL
jgi:hypothetical protein